MDFEGNVIEHFEMSNGMSARNIISQNVIPFRMFVCISLICKDRLRPSINKYPFKIVTHWISQYLCSKSHFFEMAEFSFCI